VSLDFAAASPADPLLGRSPWCAERLHIGVRERASDGTIALLAFSESTPPGREPCEVLA